MIRAAPSESGEPTALSRSKFLILFLFASLSPALWAQSGGSSAGRAIFETRCAGCHGGDGTGGEHGPSIIARLYDLDDARLKTFIREGLPTRGMPPTVIEDDELATLVGFLRTLRAKRGPGGDASALPTGSVTLSGGGTLQGEILGQSPGQMQLRSADGKIHLLREQGERWRAVTSEEDWPTYHGQIGGNRYTPMTQISKSNVGSLAPAWLFNFASTSRLQTTPIVVGGIMYVTSANECYALDAGSGQELWHFQRPLTEGLIGNAAGGFNRGATVAGDRLFMVTDHAHLLALDRFTGKVLWDTQMADWRQNYNATGAPIVVNDLVVSGTAGGEEGVRGFVAAYDQKTGEEAWRFWTVPLPGEPGSETWKGVGIAHGGAPTWFTGTYDPELDLVYWPTGNASPDMNGDQREGDNLYACSVVALNAKTGKLSWYYQFTPHDEWDWDATEPPVLIDAQWQGKPRKLLVQANRNGFFYVLDRATGELLQATPFVDKLTWASGIDADGRPKMNPNQTPTPEGALVCPSLVGASNWFSTSYNPSTGLYYVQTLESCAIFTKRPVEWEAGKAFWGGSTRRPPNEKNEKILRALDIQTGKAVWQVAQQGNGSTWGGTLSTAAGLVFYGDDSGDFVAADAETGKTLWRFHLNQNWRASPMTYMFDGKQYLAVAAGPSIVAFALSR
ncbi:MAG: PQQ-dependent dehydrogenase, methanol/ethanol family [Acidobacteria bacterium]|nr:PQQ-dependent dehydrogenase, methanol/ethanol family [Acidobacteriota bacterium]